MVAQDASTVLLVDDDPSLRRLVGRWLEREGLQIVTAGSAAEGVEVLQRVIPDAVLLDLGLPDGTGLGVLDEVQRQHPGVPVVMLTADSDVQTVVSAMQRGAWDYLVKPVQRTKLVTTVRNAVASHRAARRVSQLERQVQGGGHPGFVGQSPPMQRLYKQLDRVGPSSITVLVRGESGTGKELVASALHAANAERSGALVAINCAAIPENLIESELFGHERGAFTGADRRRVGRFEQADGGTLFLDEVGELTPAVQAKLLRVLQERRLRRLGGTDEIAVDVRIVAATHKDLAVEARAGRFRQDLYFRLAVFEVEVPALRERGADILALADHFLAEIARREGRERARLGPAAQAVLTGWGWPGNVRELQNAMERAALLADGVVLPEHLPHRLLGPPPAPPGSLPPSEEPASRPRAGAATSTLAALEEAAIRRSLSTNRDNVSAVCRELGIPRSTLYRRLRAMGLR